MKPSLLRNFGILAHIDAGKTTLSECILFLTGAESRMGAVDVGTAAMDWHSEERERGITISAAVAHCPWREHRLQFVDTPGHVDFAAEVRRSLQVLDGAIVVIDALEGVQAQTYSVVHQARDHSLPLIFVFNKMDRRCAEFASSCESAAEQLGIDIVPLQQAFFEDEKFCGIIDLVEMKLVRWNPQDDTADCTLHEIPESLLERATEGHQRLCSKVADLNPSCVDQFLEHATLQADVLRSGVADAVRSRSWCPALATSAVQRVGGQQVLDAVVDYFPSPVEHSEIILHDSQTGKDVSLSASDAETVVYVFKVERIGRQDVAYVRLFSGELACGQHLFLERTQQKFLVEDCFTVLADDLQSKAVFVCGSLFVIKADIELQSGDTLRSTHKRGALEPESLSSPVMSMRVEPPNAERRDDLLFQCKWLCRSDPSLVVLSDDNQIVLQGQGQLHLEIAANHLRSMCDYEVYFGGVLIEKYESVLVPHVLEVNYSHFDAQDKSVSIELEVSPSEAHGVQLRFSPLLSDCDDVLLERLYSSAAFEGWVGVNGYALRGLSLRVVDLQFAEGAREQDGLLVAALHHCLLQILSEYGVTQKPHLRFEIKTPDSELSAVLADLQKRNAKILAVGQQDGCARVSAEAFFSDMANYSTELRSQSHGRAELTIGAQSWKS